MTNKPLKQTLEAVANVEMSIDTCGTRCPIPLLRAKQALKTLAVGEHLEVLASDPSAKPDFDAMLRHLPHQLVSYTTQTSPTRIDTFIILKGE
jgi:tRNA 2-thiouridine synthesizing protein A